MLIEELGFLVVVSRLSIIYENICAFVTSEDAHLVALELLDVSDCHQ